MGSASRTLWVREPITTATLDLGVDTSDITVEILRRIQNEIVGMRGDMGSLRGDVNSLRNDLERHAASTNGGLAKLHDDMALTNETLGIMSERLVFAEAASAAAASARVRLDGRVDRIEADVDGLKERLDRPEAQGDSDGD